MTRIHTPSARLWRDLATVDVRPTCGAHHTVDCPWCHTDMVVGDILARAAAQLVAQRDEDTDGAGYRWAA